jgi:hypothetical protein
MNQGKGSSRIVEFTTASSVSTIISTLQLFDTLLSLLEVETVGTGDLGDPETREPSQEELQCRPTEGALLLFPSPEHEKDILSMRADANQIQQKSAGAHVQC